MDGRMVIVNDRNDDRPRLCPAMVMVFKIGSNKVEKSVADWLISTRIRRLQVVVALRWPMTCNIGRSVMVSRMATANNEVRRYPVVVASRRAMGCKIGRIGEKGVAV